MRVFLLICLVSLACSSPSVELLTLGESCDKNPEFIVQNFAVSPFPIYLNTPYTFTVSGEFLEKESIKEINIAERYNSLLWKNSQVAVGLNFAKGENHTFTIYRDGPTLKGGYTAQVTFHRNDSSSCACWQYDFTL